VHDIRVVYDGTRPAPAGAAFLDVLDRHGSDRGVFDRQGAD
jgi:hypothetical protein